MRRVAGLHSIACVLLNVDNELNIRVDAALDDEVAELLEREHGLLTGRLIAGIESEPFGFNEGMLDRAIIAVDEGDGVAPAQEQVGGSLGPALLQHGPDSAGQVCTSRSSPREHNDQGEDGHTGSVGVHIPPRTSVWSSQYERVRKPPGNA